MIAEQKEEQSDPDICHACGDDLSEEEFLLLDLHLIQGTPKTAICRLCAEHITWAAKKKGWW